MADKERSLEVHVGGSGEVSHAAVVAHDWSSTSLVGGGDDKPTSHATPSVLRTAIPRVLGLIYLCVLFAWIYRAEGGLGLQDDSMFGLHALLMSFFAVLAAQESVLSFYTAWVPKAWRLAYHVAFHVIGLACAIGGLVAIAYYKQLAPAVDDDAYTFLGNQYFPFFTMYSPHSWAAIVFLCLWGIQLGLRFAPIQKNAAIHSFLGRVVFVLGLGVCCLGFQDMQSSDLALSVPPGLNITYEPEMGYFPASTLAQLACACVMLLIGLGVAVFAATTTF